MHHVVLLRAGGALRPHQSESVRQRTNTTRGAAGWQRAACKRTWAADKLGEQVGIHRLRTRATRFDRRRPAACHLEVPRQAPAGARRALECTASLLSRSRSASTSSATSPAQRPKPGLPGLPVGTFRPAACSLPRATAEGPAGRAACAAARGCNHLVQSSSWARTRRGAARAGRGAHRAPRTGCASPPCPAPSPGTSRRPPRRPRAGACGSAARERAPRGSLRAERAEPGSETRRAPLDGVEAHGGVAAGLVRIDHEHRDPRAVLHGQAGRGGQRLLGPGAQVRVLVQDSQQQVLVANGVRRLPLAPASLQRGRCSEGTAAPQAVPPDIQEVGARVRPSCTNVVGIGQGKVGRCSRTASRSAAEAQLAPLCWRSPRPAAVPARQCRSMAQNSDRQCRSRWGKARKKRTVLQPAPHSLKRWACAVRTAHKALRVGGQCRMCGGGYAA